MTLTGLQVLLVEDSPGDAMLIDEQLRGRVGACELVHVERVAEATQHLREHGAGCVLLDLNLPLKDGREVLADMKGDDALREIPVIVLTTSSAPHDVRFAYQHSAKSYVRKPLGLDRLVETAGAIRDFWLRTATLPGSVGS